MIPRATLGRGDKPYLSGSRGWLWGIGQSKRTAGHNSPASCSETSTTSGQRQTQLFGAILAMDLGVMGYPAAIAPVTIADLFRRTAETA